MGQFDQIVQNFNSGMDRFNARTKQDSIAAASERKQASLSRDDIYNDFSGGNPDELYEETILQQLDSRPNTADRSIVDTFKDTTLSAAKFGTQLVDMAYTGADLLSNTSPAKAVTEGASRADKAISALRGEEAPTPTVHKGLDAKLQEAGLDIPDAITQTNEAITSLQTPTQQDAITSLGTAVEGIGNKFQGMRDDFEKTNPNLIESGIYNTLSVLAETAVSIGEAVQNPVAAWDMIVSSGGHFAVARGLANKARKMVTDKAIAKLGTEKAATYLASTAGKADVAKAMTAASVGYTGVSEGTLAASSARNELNKFSAEDIYSRNPEAQNLVDTQGYTKQEAKTFVINQAIATAAAYQGALAVGASKLTGAGAGAAGVPTAARPVGRGVIKSGFDKGMKEATEEAIQGGSEAAVLNNATNMVMNSTVPLLKGAGANAGQGAVAGLGSVAVMQAVGSPYETANLVGQAVGATARGIMHPLELNNDVNRERAAAHEANQAAKAASQAAPSEVAGEYGKPNNPMSEEEAREVFTANPMFTAYNTLFQSLEQLLVEEGASEDIAAAKAVRTLAKMSPETLKASLERAGAPTEVTDKLDFTNANKTNKERIVDAINEYEFRPAETTRINGSPEVATETPVEEPLELPTRKTTGQKVKGIAIEAAKAVANVAVAPAVIAYQGTKGVVQGYKASEGALADRTDSQSVVDRVVAETSQASNEAERKEALGKLRETLKTTSMTLKQKGSIKKQMNFIRDQADAAIINEKAAKITPQDMAELVDPKTTVEASKRIFNSVKQGTATLEQATTLSESGTLSESDQAQTDAFIVTRKALAVVGNEVLLEGGGKKSIPQHQQEIHNAVRAGDTVKAKGALDTMTKWSAFHTEKAAILSDALEAYKNKDTKEFERQVALYADQESDGNVSTGRQVLTAKSLPALSKFVEAVKNEARVLEAAVKESSLIVKTDSKAADTVSTPEPTVDTPKEQTPEEKDTATSEPKEQTVSEPQDTDTVETPKESAVTPSTATSEITDNVRAVNQEDNVAVLEISKAETAHKGSGLTGTTPRATRVLEDLRNGIEVSQEDADHAANNLNPNDESQLNAKHSAESLTAPAISSTQHPLVVSKDPKDSLNIFTKFFSPRVTFGKLSPLQTIPDFFGRLKQGLVDLVDLDVSANQQVALIALADFHEKFLGHFDKTIMDSSLTKHLRYTNAEKGISTEDLSLHLFKSNKKEYKDLDPSKFFLDPNVKSAFVLGAYSWLTTTASQSIRNTPSQVASILGLAEDTTGLPQSTLRQLKQGTHRGTAINTIGAAILAELNISTANAPIEYVEKLKVALGTRGLATLIEMGFIAEERFNRDVFSTLKDSASVTDAELFHKGKTTSDNNVVFVRLRADKSTLKEPVVKAHPNIQKYIDAQKDEDTINILTDVFGNDSNPRGLKTTKPNKKDIKKTIKGGFKALADNEQKTLLKHSQVPHVFIENTFRAFEYMDEAFQKEIFGFDADIGDKHVTEREGIQGKNASIERGLTTLFRSFNSIIKDFETPMYFLHEKWRQGRFGMVGDLNLQNSKIHRRFIKPANSQSKITPDNIKLFYMAIAEAFGKDAYTYEQGEKAFHEIMADPLVKRGILAANELRGDTSQLSKEEAEAVQKDIMAVVRMGEDGATFEALQGLVDYNPEGTFTTSMVGEVDSVASGVVLALLQFVGGNSSDSPEFLQLLEASGFTQSEADNFGDYLVDPRKYDLYQMVAASGVQEFHDFVGVIHGYSQLDTFKEKKAYLADRGIFGKKNHKIIGYLGRINFDIGSLDYFLGDLFDDSGEITRLARKLAKPITTVRNFGSSGEKSEAQIGQILLENVYSKMANTEIPVETIITQITSLIGAKPATLGELTELNRKEFILPYKMELAILGVGSATLGRGINSAVSNIFEPLLEHRREYNNNLLLAHQAFDITYKAALDKLPSDYTQADADTARKSVEHYMAGVEFMSSEGAKSGLVDTKSVPNYTGKYEVKVPFALSLKSGNASMATPANSVPLTDVGISAGIFQAHSDDGQVALAIMENTNLYSLNLFDAAEVPVARMETTALAQNEHLRKLVTEEDAYANSVKSVTEIMETLKVEDPAAYAAVERRLTTGKSAAEMGYKFTRNATEREKLLDGIGIENFGKVEMQEAVTRTVINKIQSQTRYQNLKYADLQKVVQATVSGKAKTLAEAVKGKFTLATLFDTQDKQDEFMELIKESVKEIREIKRIGTEAAKARKASKGTRVKPTLYAKYASIDHFLAEAKYNSEELTTIKAEALNNTASIGNYHLANVNVSVPTKPKATPTIKAAIIESLKPPKTLFSPKGEDKIKTDNLIDSHEPNGRWQPIVDKINEELGTTYTKADILKYKNRKEGQQRGLNSQQDSTIDTDTFEQNAEIAETISPESSKNIFETLGNETNPNGKVDSPEHVTHLERVLSDITSKILQPLMLFVKHDMSKTQGKFLGDKIFLSVNDPAFIDTYGMSAQQTYVHELVHAAVKTALETSWSALQKTKRNFNFVKSKVTWESFKQDGMTDAQAKSDYDHIFNNQDFSSTTTVNPTTGESTTHTLNNGYHEFVVNSVTDAHFMSILEGLTSTTDKSLLQRMMSFVSDMFTDMPTNVSSTNMKKQMFDLTVKLASINRRKSSSLLQRLETASDTLITPLNYLRDNVFKNAPSNIGEVVDMATPKVLRNSNAFEKFTKDVNLSEQSLAYSVLDEVSGTTDLKAKLHELLAASKHLIDQMREEASVAVANHLAKAYEEPLTVLQNQGVQKAVLDTDLKTLVNNQGWDKAREILADPTGAISTLESELNSLAPQNSGYYTAMAKSLGHKLVKGRHLVEFGKSNAFNIASLAGTQRLATGDLINIEKVIDQLASAYAVSFSEAGDIKTAIEVIDSEFARDTDINGIELAVHKHTTLTAEILESYNGEKHIIPKGYSQENLNSHIDYVVDSIDNEYELLGAGYQRVPKTFKRSKYDQNKGVLHLYIKKDTQLNPLMKSIISYTSQALKETTITSKSIRIKPKQSVINTTIENSFNSPIAASGELVMEAIVNKANRVVGYKYALDEATKAKYLEKAYNPSTSLGNTMGNLKDRKGTKVINQKAAEFIYEDFKENYKEDPSKFIKVSVSSDNKEYAEAMKMMTTDMKIANEKLWGTKEIFIRKRFARTLFGQRKLSISDSEMLKKTVERQTREIGYNVLNRLGAGSMEIAKEVKDFIVVKSGSTTINNIISNNSLLWMKGLSTKDITKDQIEGLSAIKAYEKDSRELQRLEDEYGIKPTEAKKARISQLQGDIAENPITAMVEAGAFPTISEDLENATDEFSYKNRIAQALKPTASIIPSPLRTLAKTAYLAHDTALYKFMKDSMQYSDLVSRYALHKHNKANGMSQRDSLRDISETFINYDLLTHPILQYMNDHNLLLFTKYKLRVLKVIANTILAKPERLIGFLGLEAIFGDIPNIMQASMITPENPISLAGELNPYPLISTVGSVSGTY